MMWTQLLLDEFKTMRIEIDAAISQYTYTRTGGKADVIAFPSSKEELQQLVKWANGHQIPFYVLGNASNVIVTDGGMSGIVIKLDDMRAINVEDTVVTCESGVTLVALAKKVSELALTGLEFACGIPGSVGGAVFMNAGAYGGEMKDVIESVDVLTIDGEFKTYTNEEMSFSYRHSIVQNTKDIVLSTTLRLSHGESTDILSKMAELTRLREEKQPLEYPSCGSVFKRPEGYFAGKLIQDAGLQGYRIGGVEVSRKHAGFMVNVDNGSATDYKQLIAYVQTVVKEQFGVTLETEVKFVGE